MVSREQTGKQAGFQVSANRAGCNGQIQIQGSYGKLVRALAMDYINHKDLTNLMQESKCNFQNVSQTTPFIVVVSAKATGMWIVNC